MKWLFIALALLNVAFLSTMLLTGDPVGEPMRAHQPLHPERISLVQAALPPVPSLPQGSPGPAPSSFTPSPAVAGTATEACYLWGPLDAERLAGALRALGNAGLADKATVTAVTGRLSYWVYLPPAETRQIALQAVEKLKEKGVKDMFVVTDGAGWKNAVSLGMFATEAPALRYLETLRRKGVDEAKLQARPSGRGEAALTIAAGPLAPAQLASLQQAVPHPKLAESACRG